MGIVYDSELSFVFLAESIIEYPHLRKDFEEYYKSDKYRFYERARHNRYYDHYNIGDATLESEVAMKRIFGILLCSEDDEAIRNYIYNKLLVSNSRFSALVNNPKESTINSLITDATAGKAKSYAMMNAPMRFLAYIFYSKYGIDSNNKVVNDYLSEIHQGHLKMSQYNLENYRKAYQFPKPDHVVVTSKVRKLISKLRTGMDISSFADFKEKEILRINSISADSELYDYIKDYFYSNDRGKNDTLKAMMIDSMVSAIMCINGSSLSGQLGQISITQDEEAMIINILASATLAKRKDKENDFKWYVDVSDYLIGLFVMLLAKEIRSMKEFYFRNNSETQYLELQRLETVIEDKDKEIERLRTELARANEQNERQKDEIKRLTDEAFKENKDAIKPFTSEISGLNSRIRDLEKTLEAEQAKTPELNALREYAFSIQSEYIPPETTTTLVELTKGKRIVIVGGHVNWRNKMKEQYPSITFLDGHNVSLDVSVFDKADFILFQTSNMSHQVYYKAIDYLRNRRLKFDYLGRSVNQTLLDAEIASILKEKM